MYFPHQVTIIRKGTELDRHGNAVTIGEELHKCRIDEGSKVVNNRQGKEVVTMTHITLPGRVTISYNDELRWTSSAETIITKKATAISSPRDNLGAARFMVVDLE